MLSCFLRFTGTKMIPVGMWGFLSVCSILAQPVQIVDTLWLQFPDTLTLSTQGLVPFSFELMDAQGETVPLQVYWVNEDRGWLILRDTLPAGDYTFRYRAFSHVSSRRISLPVPPPLLVDSAGLAEGELPGEPHSRPPAVWDSPGLTKSGSLSRGLTVRNNGGVSLNSGLQLQVEGELEDGMRIIASITDDNIPLQPEGNTQQLAELDQVSIRLIKSPWELSMGDFVVGQQESRFARFRRKVQGIQGIYRQPSGETSLSASAARGKFHINRFGGQEGVSGPYRLTGRNGERFFFVVAGSERVYLNGQLMQRGETFDYIIDYNTAEITFTARHVITSVSRIVVDFEYNDRFYNRSLMTAQSRQELKGGKWKIGVDYARDADNPQAPFDAPELFEAVRDSLAQVGDQEGQVLTGGIVKTGYRSDALGYARRDTLVGGQVYERYVYSQDTMAAIYDVSFSFVGAGKGYYTRDRTGVNENVFVWVAPDTAGYPRGSYAPVKSWVLPRLQEVGTVRLAYQPGQYLTIGTETAISGVDKNRLSPIGDNDNRDMAHHSSLQWSGLPLGDSLNLDAGASFQYIGAGFQSIDRVYGAEYDRVWNISERERPGVERIVETHLGMAYGQALRANVLTAWRKKGISQIANRQVAQLVGQFPRWLSWEYTFTRIQNEDTQTGESSTWLRHEGRGYKRWGPIELGVVYWGENRQERLGDSLGAPSLRFSDIKPYIKWDTKGAFSMESYYNYRKEYAANGQSWLAKSRGQTWFSESLFQPHPRLVLRQTLSYRDFQVADEWFRSQGLRDSRVFNALWLGAFQTSKPGVSTQWNYEVSAEQVAEREMRFVEVNPGQGQYEWLDINENGVQEAAEFQLSTNPLVANYIRVTIPGRDLRPSTKLGLKGRISLSGRSLWKEKNHGWAALIRHAELNTRVNMVQYQQQGKDLGDYFIRFSRILADSSLFQTRFSFRQDLTFFQNSPRGDLKISYLDNTYKLNLTTGDEWNLHRYWFFSQRWNLDRQKSVTVEERWGQKRQEASALISKNFDVRFWEIRPRIILQFSNKFRVSMGYAYGNKENRGDAGELPPKVFLHKLQSTFRGYFGNRKSLEASCEWVGIHQEGELGFQAAYEMREGLQPGNNVICRGLFSTYLMNNLELLIRYEGRASQGGQMLHSGNVQVRAIF